MYRHVSTALLVAGFSAACKEKKAPPPAATPAPTAYVAPITTNPQYQQVQPTVAPPLCDANLKECAPDPKIVELCRQQETDQTKCENGIEKSLYATLKARVEEATQNAAETTETCKTTRYVNTQTDPLNVRDQASTAGIIIGEVVRAGSLCVIGQTTSSDGLWYKLNYNNKVGHVFGEFTSASKPAASAAPATTTTTTQSNGSTTPVASTGECSLPCPSGYSCSKTQNWGTHAPDYFRSATEDSERISRVQGGDSICTTGNIQTVQYFAGSYTMVRIKVRDASGFSPDYWMNCKYLSPTSKARIGCQ